MPSPTEVAALQGLILRLSVVAARSVTQLFGSANSEQMKQAYPDVVDPFLSAAGTLSEEWYDSLAPGSTFDTRPSLLPARDVLSGSVGWAFSQPNPLAAMIGTTERHIFTTSRKTVVENAKREGVRFARYASVNACAWCRVLATREAVYKSAENAVKGHDNCHCMAVPVRDGDTYTPPAYVADWLDEYNTARAEVGGDLNDIVNKMRSTNKAPNFDRKLLDNATSVEEAANYISGKHGIKVDQLISSPMVNGVPIETSVSRGVDIMSAARAAKPHYIDARTAREFGQAVDDTLEKYPFLALDEIKADFYPAGNPLSSVAHASPKAGADKGNGARYVAVNQFADAEGEVQGSAYARYSKTVALDDFDSRYKEAIVDRPVYAVMIHEMGHVVDFNSGGRAQVDAFQAVRDRILRTPEAVALREKAFAEKAGAMERLYGNRFELTPEFEELEKQWHRDNLVSSYSFKDDSRDGGVYWTEALAEAFADVELRGNKAEEASKIIHKAMVDAARKHKADK